MTIVDVDVDEQYVVDDVTTFIAVVVVIAVSRSQIGSRVNVKYFMLTEYTVEMTVFGVK